MASRKGRKPTPPWKYLVTARKRAEAERRQALRDARTSRQQLEMLDTRPGESHKEREKLRG